RDGIADSVDGSITGGTAGKPPVLRDTDSDGIPDYLDTDSDNDGFPDSMENGDFNNDGIPDGEQNSGKLKTAVKGGGAMNVLWLILLGLVGAARHLTLNRRQAKAVIAAGALCALSAAPLAQADDCAPATARCWYAGAGIGASHLKPEGEVNGWSTDDSSSFAYGLYIGQQLSSTWFWELKY